MQIEVPATRPFNVCELNQLSYGLPILDNGKVVDISNKWVDLSGFSKGLKLCDDLKKMVIAFT